MTTVRVALPPAKLVPTARPWLWVPVPAGYADCPAVRFRTFWIVRLPDGEHAAWSEEGQQFLVRRMDTLPAYKDWPRP